MPLANAILHRYAAAAIIGCILINLLLRSLYRIGGLLGTLLFATLIACGLRLAFRLCQGRTPLPVERRRLVASYAAGLGVLYLLLLAMMETRAESAHGPVALLLFFLHYASYPVAAWIALRPANDRQP